MRLTFPAPSASHPVGGLIAIYQWAGALARRGHEVRIVHHPNWGNSITTIADIPFDFDPAIIHDVVRTQDPVSIPDGDFIFGYDPRLTAGAGLPLTLVQGYGIFGQALEVRAYRYPCPKICVAGWLVEVGRELGVPDDQLVHVPYGLDHETYRVVRPPEERPRRVSMVYARNEAKGAALGIDALVEVQRRVADLEVVLFGTLEPTHDIPATFRYRVRPARDEIVEIYNTSSVFVCPSAREGFGFPSVEAMACGAALVTTDNGGSRDFAFHGRTALVVAPDDPGAMADAVARLLLDGELRTSLAAVGRRYVQRFDWDASAARIEDFLHEYAADPGRFTTARTRGTEAAR